MPLPVSLKNLPFALKPMFPSLTNKFKGIDCPALLRKEKCDVINCIFKHPDEVLAMQKKMRSSSESYIHQYQSFYNQPTSHRGSHAEADESNGLKYATSPPMTQKVLPQIIPQSAPALPPPQPVKKSSPTPSASPTASKKPLFNQDRLRQIKKPSPKEEGEKKPVEPPISTPVFTSSNTTPLAKNRLAKNRLADLPAQSPATNNENKQLKRKSRFSSSPEESKKSRVEAPTKSETVHAIGADSKKSSEKRDTKDNVFKIVPRIPSQPKNNVTVPSENSLGADSHGENTPRDRPLETSLRESSPKESFVSKNPPKLSPQAVNPYPPSTLSERLKFLKEFYSLYKKQNQTEQDCIEMAVAAEYEIASSTNSSTYMNTVKQSIFKLRKAATTKDDYSIDSQYVATGAADWLALLRQNTVSRQNLVRNGYVMQVPQAPQVAEGSGDLDFLPEHDSRVNQDVKICAHCGNKFLRSEQMKRKNKCRYHPAKASFLKLNENLKNGNAYNSKVLSCCHQPVDEADEGCRRLPHHVFKCETPWEMHQEIPFITTKELCEKAPESTKKMKKLKAVGLDCEMGFTSKGFEVIRLTIVDYLSQEEILNHIVKPQGKIIDLNTDYSGVADIPENAMTFDSLRLVWSGLIGEDTILIGHGLENDLNVLRVIHTNIIDTAIKYSENTIDPKRKDSLKKLALKYLGKTIQQGQHDSLEDSVIAIEVVKERIAKRSSI